MPPIPPLPNKSSKRNVLQERNPSRANQMPRCTLSIEAKQNPQLFTPYPTKPAHVLLPTSLKDRYGAGFGSLSLSARAGKGKDRAGGDESLDAIPFTNPTRTPCMKRSVSELRNLYESQADSTQHCTRTSSHLSAGDPELLFEGTVAHPSHSGSRPVPPAGFGKISEHSAATPQPCLSIRKITSNSSLPPPPVTPPDWSNFDLTTVSLGPDTNVQPTLVSSSPIRIPRNNPSSNPERSTSLSSSPNYVLLRHASRGTFGSESTISLPEIMSMPPSSPSGPEPVLPLTFEVVRPEPSGSPQFQPEAIPSSPNFIKLGTSSPTSARIGSYGVSEASPVSAASISHAHHGILQEQPSISTLSSFSNQFTSSSPSQSRLAASPSLLDFPLPLERRPLPVPPIKTSSVQVQKDLQANLEWTPVSDIHYPVVPKPKGNPWEDLTVPKRGPRETRCGERAALRNPRLSTVPSEWSDEDQLGSFHTVGSDDVSDVGSALELSEAMRVPYKTVTASSTSVAAQTNRWETTDFISDLQVPHLRHQPSRHLGALSEPSRKNSFRSLVLRSAASNGSLQTTVRFPAWACRYYSRGLGDSLYTLRPETSDSAFSQPSQPGTAITTMVEHAVSAISESPMRGGKAPRERHLRPGLEPLVSCPSVSRLSSPPINPTDPRAHWAGAELAAIEAELRRQDLAGSLIPDHWSPHLFPDNRASNRYRWLAPSIEEKNPPLLAWRDAHVIGFMLGFIFPISWFIAAVLPLPPRPVMKELEHDADNNGPSLQQLLDQRMSIAEEVRYANLHWWRNVNRFMCFVGMVVIVVVITLAVVGTRRGFANH